MLPSEGKLRLRIFQCVDVLGTLLRGRLSCFSLFLFLYSQMR